MIHHLILNLLVAHVLGDFYLQTRDSCENKFLYSVKGKSLWLHALIIGILSWVAIWDIRGWWLALGIMIVHFLTDWLKSYLQLKMGVLTTNAQKKVIPGECKRNDLWIFLADQMVHIAIIVAGAYIWFSAYSHWNNDWRLPECLQEFIINHPLRLKTMVGLLLALKPANILILLVLETCKVNINPTKNDEHGNFHSGELIGWLERGLILLFVIMSQYEAIGFLIAAKSILRFNEASKGDEKSEYVLAGTLLSLAIALCIGICVVRI